MTSWDEITDGIAEHARARDPCFELDDGSVVSAPIHPDALEQRLKAVAGAAAVPGAGRGPGGAGRPAASAGIQAGDTITAINGRPVAQWYDLLELLQKSAGRPLAVEVARGGRRLEFQITPYVDSITGPDGKPQAIGRIGVGVARRIRSEPLSAGPGGGGGLAQYRAAPPPRSCARCGASSADESPGGRSAVRSSSANWRARAPGWGWTPSSPSWR